MLSDPASGMRRLAERPEVVGVAALSTLAMSTAAAVALASSRRAEVALQSTVVASTVVGPAAVTVPLVTDTKVLVVSGGPGSAPGQRFDGVPLTRSRATAAVRSGPIEGYGPSQQQHGCEPVARPGVVAFRDMVLTRYPATESYGMTRECHKGGRSEHKEGRAWDWKVNARVPSEKAAAEELIHWLLAPDASGNPHANARRLGIMYLVWNGQKWSAERPWAGFEPYRGPSDHSDHIHISFTWAGALMQTSFWTGEVSGAMPAPTDIPPMPAPTPSRSLS